MKGLAEFRDSAFSLFTLLLTHSLLTSNILTAVPNPGYYLVFLFFPIFSALPVADVFHFMLRYTFLNSDEFKEYETEWTERLLKEIESTETL
jgi:hypothetical protein